MASSCAGSMFDTVSVFREHLNLHGSVESSKKGSGNVDPSDDDSLPRIHLSIEARVLGYGSFGRNIAAGAEILGKYPLHEFVEIKTVSKRHASRLG